MPSSKSSTNFLTWLVAETLIPRQQLLSLDKVLSRGQTLEMKYLGRDDQKISRSGRRTSQCMVKKKSRQSKKLSRWSKN